MFVSLPSRRKPTLNWATPLLVAALWLAFVWMLGRPDEARRALEPVYRITNRGGKGVKTLNITDKTGPLLAINNVTDEEDLMIITKSGVTIRMHIDTIRTMGRAAQGVRLINLKGNAEIAAIAQVPRTDEEDEEELDGIIDSESASEDGAAENGTTIEEGTEE